MPEAHMWDPEIQTLPRDELRAVQEQRLNTLAERIWTGPAALFRRKLEAAGLGPGDPLGLGDLAGVAFTVKDELRSSEAEHPPFGDYRGIDFRKCVRIGTTGGTSGAPTTVFWTKRDLAQDDAAGARMFWRQGLRPGMPIANSHPLDVYGGGRSVTGVLENFGVLVTAVGPPETDDDARRAIELFRRVKPLTYQMFPSAYRKFYETALEMGIDPAKELNLHPPVDNPEFAYRVVTGGTEGFAYMGSACPEGGGAHVCEDFVIVEAVNDAGKPVPDGELGQMVITTLERDNFVFRYNLEDLIRINPGHVCDCGETHRRVFWECRVKDVTKIDIGGTTVDVFPKQVAETLFGFDMLRTPTFEYQIVRDGDPRRLLVRAESTDTSREARESIETALTAATGATSEVELVERGTLPRPAYKPERVVDSGGS